MRASATAPIWVDFAGHDAPVPEARDGARASPSGTDDARGDARRGRRDDLLRPQLNNRVGTTLEARPTRRRSPARRRRSSTTPSQSPAARHPIIAENELFGAQTPTPWSATNAQYRANVLALLQALDDARRAPALTIANPPYTGGDAAEWWRQVAKVAILLRQVYFTSPNPTGLYALGPGRASRSMRNGMRGLVTHFTQIGIPASRIALELQFQSAPGLGGRDGLQPAAAWFEIVKLEALAAKQVAAEFKIAGIWSWGWASFCDGRGRPGQARGGVRLAVGARPAAVRRADPGGRSGFNASLTEGQIALPAAVRCALGDSRRIDVATCRGPRR